MPTECLTGPHHDTPFARVWQCHFQMSRAGSVRRPVAGPRGTARRTRTRCSPAWASRPKRSPRSTSAASAPV